MYRPVEENQFQVFKKIANFTQLPHYRNPIGTWILDMEQQQVWRKTFVNYCVKIFLAAMKIYTVERPKCEG